MAFLQGTVDRVEPPNEHGWAKIFMTAQGHDKPVRIDTNRQEHMREAVELRDAHAWVALEYDEKSKVDRERGRTYLNRYWVRAARTSGPESATNGGTWGGPAASDPPPPAPPTYDTPNEEYQRRTHPSDAWRIALSVGSERAVQTLPYLPVDQRTPEQQALIARYWARFIYFTQPTDGIVNVEPNVPGPAGSNPATGEGYDQAPWPTDDDIPF